jgi:hypothetical protein
MMVLLALLAIVADAGRCPTAAAEGGTDLNGAWKLVAHLTGDVEWAIFKIKEADGKLIAELIDSQKAFGNPRIYLEKSPDAVVVLLTLELADITFKGPLPEGGADGRIVGALQFRTTGPVSTSGARLERTGATKVAQPSEPPENPGAKETVDILLHMRKATAEFLDARYQSLELKTAAAAALGLPIDAPTVVRAWAVSRFVEAARRAGKANVEVEAELARLNTLMAEEDRPQRVPLDVEPLDGRRDLGRDRVILLELFTGAQCGPCVAADVAFDALSKAYDSTNLITIQYHLHIPGPDPLAGPDSVSRQSYYGVRSTPSTYFSGRALAGGGGSLADSRRKFNQYSRVVEELLKGKREAKIELAARRAGDEVHITASASVGGRAGAPSSSPRLRLALVEESVTYTGRNRLPSHHHVVRSMPGGAEGKAMKGGKIHFEETIKLSEVRSKQGVYLKEYPDSPGSRGAFSDPLPPLELKELSVVAFVQDDSDRTVLDAIIVPVP